MKQFNITGMSCAACQARVEKAVSKVEGVTSCSVSLLTNSMGVEGTANDSDIIKAVTDAGYGASLRGGSGEIKKTESYDDILTDRETPALRRRLWLSVAFLAVLMYVSMGHMMLGFPLPKWFDGNHVAMGLVQLLLTIIIMIINKKFFISGFKSAVHGAPNMDTLVALGASASFIWSVYALFMMTDAQVHGGEAAAMPWMDEFYFEAAATILTLITVGKTLEAKSKGRTTDALKSLMKLAPKTAVIIRDGKEQTVPIEEVKTGDIFAVRPGESIPVDGKVLEGNTAVNESALTGESIPVDKTVGDKVSAASINQSGYIKCEATRVGEDTTLSQIIKMVSEAAATKAPIAKIADKVSGVFVPAVILIAAVTLIVWLIVGRPFDFALARSVSVLVISCPCALGLATPVAIMVGNGVGAKSGVLFKTAVSLEEAGKVNIVALDKTGTITQGQPEVTEIIPLSNTSEAELMTYAYSLEIKSEHPLAKAIVREAEKRSIVSLEASGFQALSGSGLKAEIGGDTVCGGSMRYISSVSVIDKNTAELSEDLADKGNTPLFFTKNGKLLGIIAVADTIKSESPEAVKELKNMGIQVVMLTGDNLRTAKAIGRKAGIENVIAGVLPDGKETVIRRLKELGKVAMVGDGINDAPALTSADIGIAIGAGTDVAIDAADVVLMNSKLSDVPAAIRLSRRTLTNIHENLFWAFIYNVIGIPLAAGCWISLFGWQLNPMFGAAAMSLSSFCVVTNALRLNLIKIHSAKRDRKSRKEIADKDVLTLLNEINSGKEEKSMTKTMKIEGMMCSHCEARVKKTLEAVDGVESANVSHTEGSAIVTLSKDVPDDALKSAIDEQGYTVLGID
ncbi:MAG: heavy metal translocating P-type ATPase [Acutalibacteraceae bacterium]